MNTLAKTSKTRIKDKQWCEVTIELRDQGSGPELSITGAEGSVVSENMAKGLSQRYWESFFEECPEEIYAMNKRFDRRFTSAAGAARFVRECDGDLHGIDVHEQDNGRILITESCGQIRDIISEWFPEVVDLLPYHLNNLNSLCEHQEARGETYEYRPSTGHSYEDFMVDVCPDCGHKAGASWNARPLPVDVLLKVGELRAKFKDD